MNEENKDCGTTIFPELILMVPNASTEMLLGKPEHLPLRILFYQPDELELDGKVAEELKGILEQTRRRSWERMDYIQNPPMEVREHMMGVYVTGYTCIEGVLSALVYNLKHTLANRASTYLEILKKGIPGGVIELKQNKEGIYTPNPNGGASFWFEDKLYQFSNPKYQIEKG